MSDVVAATKAQAKAWEEVGTRFVALEADLRRRLDRLGADASKERRSIERALASLADSLEHSFDGIGAAVRDVELRQDIGRLVTAVRQALETTFPEPARHLTGARDHGRPSQPSARSATARKASTGKRVAKKAAPASKKVAARKAPAKKTAVRVTAKGRGKATAG